MLFFANKMRFCTDFKLVVWPGTDRKVFGVGGWRWWLVVNSEFSVLLWSKAFHSSLSFGIGPSRTIISFVIPVTSAIYFHNIY